MSLNDSCGMVSRHVDRSVAVRVPNTFSLSRSFALGMILCFLSTARRIWARVEVSDADRVVFGFRAQPALRPHVPNRGWYLLVTWEVPSAHCINWWWVLARNLKYKVLRE